MKINSLPVESIDNLFQPNNHSNWAIEYRDVEPKISDRIARLIGSHHHFLSRRVISVQQFKGTEISSHNYKVQVKTSSGKIRYILIRAHKEFDSDFIRGVIEACEYLSVRSCSVPKVVGNDSGNYVTDFEGERYTVYTFIEGTHFQGNLGELLNVASKLARLDLCLLGMEKAIQTDIFKKPDIKRKELETFSKDIWNDLIGRARSRKRNDKSDYFDEAIIAAGKYIFEAIESVQSVKNQWSTQLVHSDLHPHNLITDGSELLAFIDIDSLRFWERMRAVSFAIHRLVLQCLVKNKISPANRREIIKFIKNEFISTYDALNPLSPYETKSVGYFIQHEALRRVTSVAKGFYVDGKEEWKRAIYKQIRSLLEAKYFMD